jgi:predicted permease
MLQDLRLACRLIWQRPAFSATAVLTLAIGMGVNTVAFTLVNGLLFQGRRTSARTDLGRVLATPGGDEGGNGSLPDYERLAEATRGALDLAAEGRSSIAWHHDGATETAWVLYVTPNYFSMIDVAPIAGRIEVARTPAGPLAVVIGERFWREKLASRAIAGLSLRLNHADVDVVGILPESYTGPAGLYSPDVWLPLQDLALFKTSPALAARETRWLFFLGRLLPGASPAEVQGRLDTAAAMMARDWPESHRDRGARFRMIAEGNSELRGLAAAAAIGMSLMGLVLLLACFNVANLLLARAVERERDMGIRTALGARPGRLMRLVIAEGVVVAAASGGLALVVARWTQTLLGSFAIPIEQPQHIDLSPDATVVGFVALLVIVAGVLPGLWPAVSAARVNVARVLGSQGGNASGGRPSRLRAWLVGAQVAGSTAFLAMAALFVQSVGHLSDVDPGFDRDHLVAADVEPASQGLGAEASERYVDALLTRTRALPGVADAAVIDRAPFFMGFDREVSVWPGGQPCGDACPKVRTHAAGPGYFRTMGITMSSGREFQRVGAAGEVIVNQPFARRQWPDGRAVGETIRTGDRGDTYTVIGVTASHHTRGPGRELPTLYFPVGRIQYEGALTMVARTQGDPAALVRPIVEAAREVNRDVPLLAAKTMRQRMAMPLWPFRTLGWLFSICGTLALLLATAGLAGVVIHSVNRRRREFGVRLSIGARPSDLVAEVLRGSAALLIPGVAVGLAIAVGLGRVAEFMLFGVNVFNPVTYLVVAMLEGAVVIIACLAPAIRASRVDPLSALRAD